MKKILKSLIQIAVDVFLKNSKKSTSEKEESFYEFLEKYYLKNGAEFDADINIFGIRDDSEMPKGIFNDYIGVAINGDVQLFKGTCDPSDYWTKENGIGDKGVAHICLGFHKNVYIVGKHKNKYEALVQQGAKIKIWRDKNKNFQKNKLDPIESGFFGTNIHRASEYKILEKIGKYSAGCQVIQDPADFKRFMEMIKNSNKYKKNKNSKFSYFLIDKNNIPDKFLK